MALGASIQDGDVSLMKHAAYANWAFHSCVHSLCWPKPNQPPSMMIPLLGSRGRGRGHLLPNPGPQPSPATGLVGVLGEVARLGLPRSSPKKAALEGRGVRSAPSETGNPPNLLTAKELRQTNQLLFHMVKLE